MKFLLLIFLTGLTAAAFAQEKVTEGIVFDKNSKERIAKVFIQNMRTGKSMFNTLQAEFKISTRTDDQLIISKQGYFTDTLKIPANGVLMVYLKPTAIQLRQVDIRDTLASPLKRYLATKAEYSKAYGSNAYRDPLTLTPGMGAGISIDAIWNSISREGKNAAHLQGIIEEDFHQSEIDYRFNKTFVANITGLKDPQLTDFMQKYRPGYFAVKNYSPYEFIESIRANYKRYMRNRNSHPNLPKLQSDEVVQQER